MAKKLKVYTCNDHRGHAPTNTASVVVAESKAAARVVLEQRLDELGLGGGHFTLVKLSLDKPGARVLSDGDY
jgi:hypothetical protein